MQNNKRSLRVLKLLCKLGKPSSAPSLPAKREVPKSSALQSHKSTALGPGPSAGTAPPADTPTADPEFAYLGYQQTMLSSKLTLQEKLEESIPEI